MFRQLYELCLAVFLLQGALLPLILVAAGAAWFRQMARLSGLEKALRRDRKRRERTLASLLQALPKLQPLNCAGCGAAVALEAASSICTSCRSVAELPQDYAATVSLRRGLKRLSRLAVRHWLVARVLVSTPARLFFFLMIFGEPLIFTIVLIGAATYSDSFADRAFERIGEGWAMALMVPAFGGFILWMIVFIFLHGLSKELRRTLTAFPGLGRARAGALEYSSCMSCGGGVRFDSRAFACLCGYCAVENYRADHVRRERSDVEESQLERRASLFGASEIIEGFTGTFFVTMTILFTGFLLLALFAALGSG